MLGRDAMHGVPDIPSATGPRLFTSGGSWQEGDEGRWGQSRQVCAALSAVLPWHWRALAQHFSLPRLPRAWQPWTAAR